MLEVARAQETAEEASETKATPKRKSGTAGAVFGLITFLGGIVLLLLTFKLAFEMFAMPPSKSLGIEANQPVDLAKAGNSLAEVFLRFVALLIMSVVGSVIANRGIKLYSDSR